ncbi:MAG: MerR family transcriptional regulator [Peptococcaceae bacterium]|jgi:DNA-binding transcriptional MerR regulator|nr:MerR family transcriptional regulator [Peptococcaceae bacterium]
MNTSDLLSISNFSKLTGINRSTLIYYDEMGIFSPFTRGENNYRYYSPQQVITINLVNVLSSLNVPLKEIRELVQDRTPENILALILQQSKDLDHKIHWMQESLKIISTLQSMMQMGLAANEEELSVCTLEDLPIILGPVNKFGNFPSFYETFTRFCNHSKKLGLNLNYPVGGFFEDIDVFLQAPARPTRFFFVNPDGTDKRAAGRYLVGYTRGYYGQTNDLPEKLAAYAKTHSLSFCGPVYNIYLLDEISISDPNQYLLQVSVPVS